VSLTKEAEQRKIVAVTHASRQYEVGQLELEAATKEAAALVARGRAEANVVLYDFQARAEPLKNAVDAFGDGMTYAQHFFFQKVAPAMQTILSNTEGPFADVFKSFQQIGPPGKSIAAASTASKGGDQ
jgi:regulator of protease activity HflC (stomatin/prohibitin superfamily)